MSFLKLSELSPSWILNVTEILESLVTCYMTHDRKVNTHVSSKWTWQSNGGLKMQKCSYKSISRPLQSEGG